jgi:hypothetical protein
MGALQRARNTEIATQTVSPMLLVQFWGVL